MIQIQSVSDLVSQIKLAVQQAQSSLEKSGVSITRIDLEIKTALALMLVAACSTSAYCPSGNSRASSGNRTGAI